MLNHGLDQIKSLYLYTIHIFLCTSLSISWRCVIFGFLFFHIYNVFMIIVVKTPDRPGVKFILIIVYIPYEIVYIHMSQYIIKKINYIYFLILTYIHDFTEIPLEGYIPRHFRTASSTTPGDIIHSIQPFNRTLLQTMCSSCHEGGTSLCSGGLL